MPCGTKIPVNRVLGLAADFRNGVCAGIIESSNGRASATLAPRKNVLRGIYFLLRNVMGVPRDRGTIATQKPYSSETNRCSQSPRPVKRNDSDLPRPLVQSSG